MEAVVSADYVWPDEPTSYADHYERGLYVKEIINETKVKNFENALLRVLEANRPDLLLINTPEAVASFDNLSELQRTKTLFYTHHENLVFPPDKASKVFDPSYNEFLYAIPQNPNLQIATQSRHNIARMDHLKFRQQPIVLPMPLPDPELMTPYSGPRDGVLFIGRHEPRKNPKLFAKTLATTGLPVKVLTNKRGVAKFEKTFAHAGVSNYQIEYELTGKAKADFLKSARMAFHPAVQECFAFSTIESLAVGLPTLLIEEHDWWRAFTDFDLHVVPKAKAAEKLKELYEQPVSPSTSAWHSIEAETQKAWAELDI